MSSFKLKANFVDVHKEVIYPAEVSVVDGKIAEINSIAEDAALPYLLPGLIDAHVHVESSMLLPTEFARMAVVHGTVASVSDPHEIGNVLGVEGVRYMIENGKRVPFKFNFGAPSCVPATSFETAGAVIGLDGIESLMSSPDVGYLAEVMNFPAVLGRDPEIMGKIEIAKKYGKPIDGHAPGLNAEDSKKYAAAGISTDHECFSLQEGKDKLAAGMKVLIREGSAAKNFDALIPLLQSHPDQIMFCSDDKHPNDLVLGHINSLLARAVKWGIDPIKAIRAATLNPAEHYRMPVGLLRKGDPADFITVKDLTDFEVTGTWIDGKQVSRNGKTLLESISEQPINKFDCPEISADQLKFPRLGNKLRHIIVDDGQIVTRSAIVDLTTDSEQVEADLSRDLLKLVVVNRYNAAKPSIAFVQGFQMKEGALASTVAHDSHNIIAVGASDEAIARAIELVRQEKGGISLAGPVSDMVLPLPVAGLMSTSDGWTVAKLYEAMDAHCKTLGCALTAPYMSLSFLALLVIPELKLSDKGLFDGKQFSFVDPFV